MCYWPRWPHAACFAFALLAVLFRGGLVGRLLLILAALAIAVSGGIGIFHAGVEYGWWEGLTACSTSAAIGNAQDILNDIMATPLVRCDVPQWTLLGISLAGYNAILSLGAAIAIFALMFGRTEIGRAHVCTPVTNAHLVCRLLREKNSTTHNTI